MFYSNLFDELTIERMYDEFVEVYDAGEADDFTTSMLFYLFGANEIVYAADCFEVPGVDFSEESLTSALNTAMLMHIANLHEGMDEEESKMKAFSSLAGYYLFMFHNILLENGNNPELWIDDESDKMILCAENEDGEEVQYDVMEEMGELTAQMDFRCGEEGMTVKIPMGEFLEGFNVTFQTCVEGGC